MVSACIAYFDQLWSHAVTTPGFGTELALDDRTSSSSSCWRGGAKDEQIARTMGISLRTVRRRIASLLAELGVDSRFQAGMEAVRRGLALAGPTGHRGSRGGSVGDLGLFASSEASS